MWGWGERRIWRRHSEGTAALQTYSERAHIEEGVGGLRGGPAASTRTLLGAELSVVSPTCPVSGTEMKNRLQP